MVIYLGGNCVKSESRGVIVGRTRRDDNRRSLAANPEVETSMSVSGKRERPTMDVVEPSDGYHLRRAKRYRVAALRTALVHDMEEVNQHAKWWDPE